MNVYTCNTFRGHYPVGAAAVVVAKSAPDAARKLELALAIDGIPQSIDPSKMTRLVTHTSAVRILCNGDY